MRLSEIVGTERRVSEVVRQRIPGHRTGDGERPTAERAATMSMSWYDKMVAAGRLQSLTTGNVQCRVAAVHDVPGSPALVTPVNCHSELMKDPLPLSIVCDCPRLTAEVRHKSRTSVSWKFHGSFGEFL